jgi:hypothetical protein
LKKTPLKKNRYKKMAKRISKLKIKPKKNLTQEIPKSKENLKNISNRNQRRKTNTSTTNKSNTTSNTCETNTSIASNTCITNTPTRITSNTCTTNAHMPSNTRNPPKRKMCQAVIKRIHKKQKLEHSISNPQKFHTPKYNIDTLIRHILPNDIQLVFKEFAYPFALANLASLLEKYVFNGTSYIDCVHLALSMDTITKEQILYKYASKFAHYRHYLFLSYCKSVHIDRFTQLLHNTETHFLENIRNKHNHLQLYRKKAMYTSLLFYQCKLPIHFIQSKPLYIIHVKKSSLVGCNGQEYHLDLHAQNEHFSFTRSRFDLQFDFSFLPNITFHKHSYDILRILLYKFQQKQYGFFSVILEMAGLLQILHKPNFRRKSGALWIGMLRRQYG